MKIDKFMYAGLIILLFVVSCGKKEEKFSISGKITHAQGETIYLEELLVSSSKPIDSVVIDKKGEFKFKGITHFPTYYLLKLSENKFVTLLVDSLEHVVVEADAANFGRSYRVGGSLGSLQVKILNDQLLQTRKKLDSLRSLDNMYKRNPHYIKLKKEWTLFSDSIKKEQAESYIKFVMDNPFSLASVFALYQKFDENEYVINDLHTMRVAASALHTVYPKSDHANALYQNTVEILKQQKNARLQQIIQEQGENSPDIVLPNPEGKQIALSSLRGKVVLLHFWSALNKDSRILNQALVEAYKKYKGNEFEIYQVSVDKDRMEWVDAIDKDMLNWINVGDMKGSNHAVMTYNIKNVPYNYLLNKKGEIVAKDLRGPELNKALLKMLN